MDMDRRKLLLYLLLNVLISACVAGAILFWYDRNYRVATLSSIQPARTADLPRSSARSDRQPQCQDIPVEIVSIVGAGLLDAEWVTIKNAGDEPLNLSRWQLKDSDKNIFVFPNLTLNTEWRSPGPYEPGTNTVIDLYWNARRSGLGIRRGSAVARSRRKCAGHLSGSCRYTPAWLSRLVKRRLNN